jgi:hypothetical protein
MWKIATVRQLHDGQLIRVQAYRHHAQALEAVGLSE